MSQLGEPIVVNLSDIDFVTTKPYTRNGRGELIQTPYIEIKVNKKLPKFMMIGKGLLWAYLDALFEDDPLPRGPVNEDIFAPKVDGPSLYSLLNSFTQEVMEGGTNYIVMYHNDFVVTYFESFNASVLSDINVLAEGLAHLCPKPVEKRPFVYKSSKVTIRPSLMMPINGCLLEVIDIGQRWYYRLTAQAGNDVLISLIQPTTTKKNDKGETFAKLQSLIGIASRVNVLHIDGHHLGTPMTNKGMRTNEIDTILYRRGLSI
jgi:hypothetical protein